MSDMILIAAVFAGVGYSAARIKDCICAIIRRRRLQRFPRGTIIYR